MSQIAKASLAVTVLSALGLCLGLLSNIIIASKFGANQEMDVFLAATTLPLFITGILSSSLNYTFIPVFADYRAKEPKETWNVVSSLINLSIVVTTMLCIVGMLLAYPIMKVLAPGFGELKLVKSASLLQLLFPTVIFNTVNTLMASVYYSNQRFVIPSLNSIVGPLLIMIYVTLFHDSLSTTSIVLAMLTAAILQMVLLGAGFLKKRDFNYSFVLEYNHPGVVKILTLMTPLVLGMLIYRATPLVDRYFLSMLSDGRISHIGYAQKLLNVIPQLITSGLTIAIFPLMSRFAAENRWEDLKIVVSKGIRQVLFFVIPVVFFLSVSSSVIVRLVYERGAFSAEDSAAVSKAFMIYLFSLLFSTASNLTNCYYVLKDTMTPLVIGIISTLVYIFICSMLIHTSAGYLAFPVAYLIYYSFVIVHAVIIRKKLGGRGGRRIIRSIYQFTFVSAVIAPALYLINKNLDSLVLKSYFVAFSFIVYFLVCNYLLRSEEALAIQNKLLNMLNFRRVGVTNK